MAGRTCSGSLMGARETKQTPSPHEEFGGEVLSLPSHSDGRLLPGLLLQDWQALRVAACLPGEGAGHLFQTHERDILGSTNIGMGELAAELAVGHPVTAPARPDLFARGKAMNVLALEGKRGPLRQPGLPLLVRLWQECRGSTTNRRFWCSTSTKH